MFKSVGTVSFIRTISLEIDTSLDGQFTGRKTVHRTHFSIGQLLRVLCGTANAIHIESNMLPENS